jgi:hypothetical protein
MDATFDRRYELRRALGLGEAQHRQHDREHVLGAMVDLARQHELALFGTLAFGDVDGDAVHAHRSALGVVRDHAGPVAPAHLAGRANDAEFDLEAVLARGDDGGDRILLAILGMDHRLDALDGGLERGAIDAEDPVGPVIPFDTTGSDVDLPRAHVAGAERDRPPFLAAPQLLGLCFQLGCSLGDSLFELLVHCLELSLVLR